MMLAIRETKLYENLTYVPQAARSYYSVKNIRHVHQIIIVYTVQLTSVGLAHTRSKLASICGHVYLF